MTRRRWILLAGAAVLAAGLAVGADQARLWWGSRAPADEAERLAALARVGPGRTVAEIGAGGGEMARVLGATVLPGGRMFITEIDESSLQGLRALVAGEGWTHAEVRAGEATGTALPDRCCDLVYLRHVYHHFEDRPAMARALARAVAPGGRLAVIDFAPQWSLALIAPLSGGHGVTADEVIAQLTAVGLILEHHEPRWTSSSFLVVMRASPQ